MAILNHSHVNFPINLICMQPWYWCPLDSLHRMPRLITLPCNNSVFCTPRFTYIMAHEDTPFIVCIPKREKAINKYQTTNLRESPFVRLWVYSGLLQTKDNLWNSPREIKTDISVHMWTLTPNGKVNSFLTKGQLPQRRAQLLGATVSVLEKCPAPL